MSVLQGDQDHPVVDADGGPVGEGEIVCSLRQSDIVDYEVAISLRNDLADLVFDRLKNVLRRFDARGGRRPDMKLDLAAVDRGIEVAANKSEHDAAQREDQRGDDRDDPAPFQEHREQPDIALAKLLEGALEPLVKARKPVARAGAASWCSPLSNRPMMTGVKVLDSV